MAFNQKLIDAKANKNDEFYTIYEDIENEVQHYESLFKDKIVYCNCDNPIKSNFWKYFHRNFARLGLKKLVATCYGIVFCKYEYCGGNDEDTTVYSDTVIKKGNGDFRCNDCVEILKECDIVVTNPPFSLLAQFLRLVTSLNKQFLIIGNQNVVTAKGVFDLIKENKIWIGESFRDLIGYFYSVYDDVAVVGKHIDNCIRVSGVTWFTNLPNKRRNEKFFKDDSLVSYKGNEDKYQRYENCPDVINCDKTKDIPYDYDGVIGVPISFINKYNPNEFRIVGMDKEFTSDHKRCLINGQRKYARMFIKVVR